MKKRVTFVFLVLSLLPLGLWGCKESSGPTSMRTTPFEDAQGGCTKGGVKIEVLEDGSVDDRQTQYICHGVEGNSGTQTSIRTTPFVDNQGGCPNGGVKVEILVDADGKTKDGQTQYICNGAHGQTDIRTNIRTTRFEDAQGSCTKGGVKIEVVVDGVVDDSQTQYVCNGTQGEAGVDTNIRTTRFEDAQGGCTKGGVKIEVLVNGSVDDTQTQYLCNGTQEKVDVEASIRTTQFTDAQGGCAKGGVKVEVLVDGAVDDSQTQYICNGAQGQTGANMNILTTHFADAQGGCAYGGVKIEVSVDGVVDDSQTQYICNLREDCLTDTGCRESAYCDQATFTCIPKRNGGEACDLANQCLSGVCTDHLCFCTTNRECGMNAYCKSDGSCTPYEYNVGSVITFGAYNDQSIHWYILDKDETNHRVLLLAMDILEYRHYHDRFEAITWEKSNIRAWLNGYETPVNFMSSVFTPEEKARIARVQLENPNNPSNNTPGGESTSDWVFLLSIDEAKTLLGTGSKVCTKINCTDKWWLRSPGTDGTRATRMFKDGSIPLEGYEVDVYNGVRPALWFNY